MAPQDFIVLSYAGPPVIGAFIGYLTNKIAIRMLFRPLKPWHVFGVRVPMTPGVIPSKRHSLAENIGDMVGNHLLTSTDIGTALSAEPFQEHLNDIIGERLLDLFKKDLGPVQTLIPSRFQAYFKVGIKTLKYRLSEEVSTYLESEDFKNKVKSAVLGRLDALADHKLNEILSLDSRNTVYGLLSDFMRDLLHDPIMEERLALYLSAWIREIAENGSTLHDILSDEMMELLNKTIQGQAPQILRHLGAQLSDPVIRGRIIQAILGGVDHFIDSLGSVGAMARGFIDMDSLEGTIDNYLAENEEQIIAWLQNPEVEGRLTTALQGHVESFLQTPLADLLDKIDDARFEATCLTVANQLFSILRSEGTTEALVNMLRSHMEDLFQHGQRSFRDLGGQLFPEKSGDALRLAVVDECVAMLQTERTKKLMGTMVAGLIDVFMTRPVGMLYNLVPSGVRSGMTGYLVLLTNRMLLKEVPGLVDSLQLRRVVTEKVDSLDLIKLERLLLSIMEEQFKYINLFGALLGFLIGLINLALLHLI